MIIKTTSKFIIIFIILNITLNINCYELIKKNTKQYITIDNNNFDDIYEDTNNIYVKENNTNKYEVLQKNPCNCSITNDNCLYFNNLSFNRFINITKTEIEVRFKKEMYSILFKSLSSNSKSKLNEKYKNDEDTKLIFNIIFSDNVTNNMIDKYTKLNRLNGLNVSNVYELQTIFMNKNVMAKIIKDYIFEAIDNVELTYNDENDKTRVVDKLLDIVQINIQNKYKDFYLIIKKEYELLFAKINNFLQKKKNTFTYEIHKNIYIDTKYDDYLLKFTDDYSEDGLFVIIIKYNYTFTTNNELNDIEVIYLKPLNPIKCRLKNNIKCIALNKFRKFKYSNIQSLNINEYNCYWQNYEETLEYCILIINNNVNDMGNKLILHNNISLSNLNEYKKYCDGDINKKNKFYICTYKNIYI